MLLKSGSTIGMLGGGQLGRMFTVAARTLDYRVVVLDPDTNSPAGALANEHVVAAYDDQDALQRFGQQCDVITTEFENIPAETLSFLTQFCPVHPSADAVKMAQDRVVEKEFVQSCGLRPVPFVAVRKLADLNKVEDKITFPAILKTARLGYDGKGQVTVNSTAEAEQAFQALNEVECVLEQRVDLEREVSVILARNVQGQIECFPVAENVHVNGILHSTTVPAAISDDLAQSAKAAAKRMAEKLQFVGVMAVEFFVTKQGELLVNEMAPRTHNSGHYTLDACVTSQFEQQVRMVTGLPFGSTRLLSPVVMINLLGDVWPNNDVPAWEKVLSESQTKLHLYGKQQARTGRKMGHFCTLNIGVKQAYDRAQQLFEALTESR